MEMKYLMRKPQFIMMLGHIINRVIATQKNEMQYTVITKGELEVYGTRYYVDRLARIFESYEVATNRQGDRIAKKGDKPRPASIVINNSRFVEEIKDQSKEIIRRVKNIKQAEQNT